MNTRNHRRGIYSLILILFFLNSISFAFAEEDDLDEINDDRDELDDDDIPASLLKPIIAPVIIKDFYYVKISENPLELGKTVEIVLGTNLELPLIQALIEYDCMNHTMKTGGPHYWYCDNWKPSALGLHPFKLHMKNKTGDWSNYSDVLEVVIDTTPPEYSSIDGDSKEVNPGENIVISINVKDLYGINTVLLEFGGNNHSMVNLPSTDIWQCEIAAPESEGTYDYIIYMEDNNNNWNVTSGVIQVVEDIDDNSILPLILSFTSIAVFVFGILIGGFIVSKIKTKKKSRKTDIPPAIISNLEVETDIKKLLIIECPTCKKIKKITIPLLFKESGGIKILSIPKNLVCEHSFQVFIDRFYHIRGYQPVDYEIEPDKNRNK